MEHSYVKFGDLAAAVVVEISCGKTDRQTNKQTPLKTLSQRLRSAWTMIIDKQAT